MVRTLTMLVGAALGAIGLVAASAVPAHAADEYCGVPVTDVGQVLTRSGAAAAIDGMSDDFYRQWLDPITGGNPEVCGAGLAVINEVAAPRVIKIAVGASAWRWIKATRNAAADLPREDPAPDPLPAVGGPGGGPTAPVSWTGSAGLLLLAEPGGEHIQVMPDGTVVTLLCATDGPAVSGPYGTTTMWDRVSTTDGTVGYASDAYLDTGTAEAVVPPC